MHELSIALSILEIVEDEAQRRGGMQVRAVHVKLGSLSGVVKDALVAAYEMARSESRFSESQLVIEEVPVVIYCHRCQAECEAESLQLMRCRSCGSPSNDVVGGRELEITALEVEE